MPASKNGAARNHFLDTILVGWDDGSTDTRLDQNREPKILAMKSNPSNGSSRQLMCEIDNAWPKSENLQMAEKLRGWLGF